MHHSRPLESARESWQDDDRINLSMGTVHAIIDDFPYEVRSFLRQIRLALNGTIVGNTVAKTVAHH